MVAGKKVIACEGASQVKRDENSVDECGLEKAVQRMDLIEAVKMDKLVDESVRIGKKRDNKKSVRVDPSTGQV